MPAGTSGTALTRVMMNPLENLAPASLRCLVRSRAPYFRAAQGGKDGNSSELGLRFFPGPRDDG
jgi:hypothetical protein